MNAITPTVPAPDFAIRNLSVLNYANGFSLWHYKLAGVPLARALEPGFFDFASDMIRPGDVVLITAPGVAAYCSVDDGAQLVPMMATEDAA